jgi:hypothetical protein
MRDRNLGMDELQTIAVEWQRTKEEGADRQRVDCGTDVVDKAGQGQFRGARPTTNRVFGFENGHRFAGLRQSNGCCQPIGAGPDHDGIEGQHPLPDRPHKGEGTRGLTLVLATMTARDLGEGFR